MKIGYGNINSIRSKTENDDILKLLTGFDMFWLSELKTDSDIHIPGFKCFRNNVRYDTHGGVALFIKHCLESEVKGVKYVKDDAVFVSFMYSPDVVFAGWYIPPIDSKYADNHIFANMSSHLCYENRSVVMVGDFNAKIKERNVTIKNKLYTYSTHNHPQNQYGEMIQCIAKDNDMVLLNGLNRERNRLDDSLTYRKKDQWVSCLDLMFCSVELLHNVENFEVMQGNCRLPSDHAVISASLKMPCHIDLKKLLQRAVLLNEYDVQCKPNKRGIKFCQIDPIVFMRGMEKVVLPELSIQTLNLSLNTLAHSMYESAANSLLPRKEWDTELSRWRRLLESDS